MKRNTIYFLCLLTFTFNISCSEDESNGDSNQFINEFSNTKFKKVTITNGNNEKIYELNYDSDKILQSITIKESYTGRPDLTKEGVFTISYDNNGRATKAIMDCSTSNCNISIGTIFIADFREISFDYTDHNGYKTVDIEERWVKKEENGNSILVAGENEKFELYPNNFMKSKKIQDYILEPSYKDQNIFQVYNETGSLVLNEYSDFDDKKAVIVYADSEGFICTCDYVYSLILNIKHSKNNFRKVKIAYYDDAEINFTYDTEDRPLTRIVTGGLSGGIMEKYEYLD